MQVIGSKAGRGPLVAARGGIAFQRDFDGGNAPPSLIRAPPSRGDGSDFSRLEWSGRGAPLHRHEVDSESFYVLDGAITFTDAAGTHVANAGDFIYLPARSAHAFVNAGPAMARAVVVASPGAEAERFFGEVDTTFGQGPPDVAALTAIAARHGLAILPPAAA